MARAKYYDETSGTWRYLDKNDSEAPVQSVNGKTGKVTLGYEDVGAEESGAVSSHNTSPKAHQDIRKLIDDKLSKSEIEAKEVKLTLADGTNVIRTILVFVGEDVPAKYTNQVPISIDTDGSVYDGKGYADGYRFNSSGEQAAQAGTCVTGYIPYNKADVIRMKGVEMQAETLHCGFMFFDSNFNKLCGWHAPNTVAGPNGYALYNGSNFSGIPTYSEDNNGITTYQFTNFVSSCSPSYVRIFAIGNGADMIVTLNEEITD